MRSENSKQDQVTCCLAVVRNTRCVQIHELPAYEYDNKNRYRGEEEEEGKECRPSRKKTTKNDDDDDIGDRV